ncbi:hypothetical protein [Shimia sp.]
MPKRIYKDNTMENANIEFKSLAEKARERRLRALMASNRELSNIFV